MITVEHLTKRYGDFTAVDDLSFEIEEGHVYGFLGPNGAGKSTTMNIMTGCLSATAGRVIIDGYDIFEDPDKAKRLMGYLPEQPPLYLNETPVEYLKFVGEAKGLRGRELAADWQLRELEDGSVQGEIQTEAGEMPHICRQIFFAFARREKALLQLAPKKANLEDVFIELTEGDSGKPGAEEGKTAKRDTEEKNDEERLVEEP